MVLGRWVFLMSQVSLYGPGRVRSLMSEVPLHMLCPHGGSGANAPIREIESDGALGDTAGMREAFLTTGVSHLQENAPSRTLP